MSAQLSQVRGGYCVSPSQFAWGINVAVGKGISLFFLLSIFRFSTEKQTNKIKLLCNAANVTRLNLSVSTHLTGHNSVHPELE